MKAFGLLLLYFFTWRTVIIGSVFVGVALLGLASSVFVFSTNAATAAAMLAFVFLLVVPYLSAPKALRAIISNRRLALVPGLPLRTGLAMLLLTLATGSFIPLIGWLLDAPGTIFWLGPQIFIIASLYTLVTQMLVTSQYLWVHINWLPIALIVLLSLFDQQLLWLATNGAAVTLLAALAFAGWLYALLILARRRNFKPSRATDIQTADSDTASFIGSLFNGKPGPSSNQGMSPTASLLLGYPANLRSRALNLVFLIVFNPLLAVLLVKFTNRNNDGDVQLSTTELFLAMSLFTSFVAGSIAWARTSARTRLLWLRVPGARAKVWETLESELWNYFLLLFAVTAAIAAVIALLGEGSMLLVHYVLTIFTLTFYQRYLPLAARVNGWSSLTQALVWIASIAAIAVTLAYSLSVAHFNLAFLLELCLLLMGVLFRAFAKFGFNRVDWQVLRHAVSKRAAEGS
jgi:hypothetical protein